MERSGSSAGQASQKEIDLVEKAYWQIALTDSDEKLERALGRLLAPVLLKASSKDSAVREKVKEIVRHVMERLNNLDQVRLPMDALFVQCQNQQTEEPTLVYNIQLLAMGYPRLSAKDRAGFAVDVLKCLPRKSSAQQASLLRLFILGLAELKLPKDVQERKTFLALDDFTQSKEALLGFLQDFLLLPYGNVLNLPDPHSLDHEPSSVLDSAEPRVKPPAGLSFMAVERVSGKQALEPETLEKMKMDVLCFLTSEVFTEEDIILLLLIATGDTRQSVADFAEDKLKIFGSQFDWNCKPIVLRIYSLFHGSPQPQSRQPQQGRPLSTAPGTKLELQRSPVHIRLKLKLVPYLLRSDAAADMFPQSVQLVFECLFGAETHPRLKLLGAQFLHHMCERSSDTLLIKTAPVLLKGLYKIISEQDNQKLRELAFVGIGKLAHRTPQIFRKDVDHAVKMFDALGKETQDVCLAVQECLSLLSSAYVGAAGLAATALEALVLECVESELPRVRVAAAHFANTVFPSDHVPSCYVRILAAGDDKHEIREEGKKGLCLAEKEENEFKFPSFSVLVSYLASKSTSRMQSGRAYTTSSSSMPLPPVTFGVALHFCQTCLHRGGGIGKQEELTLAFLLPLKKHLEELCASGEGKEPLAVYVSLIKQALAPCGGGELHDTAMECMLELVATAPRHAIQGLLLDSSWVKGLLGSPHSGTREKTARLLGFLSATMRDVQLRALLNELLQDVDSKELERQHGAVLALGFVGKHALLQSMDRTLQMVAESQEDPVELASKRPRAGDITLDVVTKLASFVSPSGAKLLGAAACASLGELARVAPLPLPDGIGDKATTGESDETMMTPGFDSKSGLAQLVADYLDSVNDVKCKRQAAVALGLLVVGDKNLPSVRMILTSLFETAKLKQFDLHMTVGKAISCAAAGRFSKAATDPWEAAYGHDPEAQKGEVVGEGDNVQVPGRIQENLRWTLEKIISTKYAVSSVLGQRQAAGLWLVALLKFCGHLVVIKEYLKDFQMVFVNMLTDDAVTQEVASSGLGLVYELSGEKQKKEIVSTLTSTLLAGRRPTQSVSSDTKLFPEGVVGKTPSGESLTTYKELCSVASDMNQPDLVYKFLSLSTHHSVWNSKKGAAYGFQQIAERAKEELKPYLPTLVPKLYRYQYDPHGGIQQSMKSIWSSVVPDSKKAVAQYQKEIMNDLMQNLNHNLWRNRESSCLALSDLLVVSATDDIVPYLPQLWELCLRVQDDIKESVRQAASLACQSLSKVTLRSCDLVGGEANRASVDLALADIFPLLLEKGMASPAKEVRGISLLTLLKLTEEAGAMLKPHIPLLVPVLLENVSSLEPQVLNYISLKLEGSEDQEKLDQIRVSSSKSSPLMEAVKFCMPHIDGQVMEKLVPRLADIIKSGIGVSTKVNTAQFVVTLDRQSPQEFSPFIGKVMAALLAGLGDRSAGVRKAYADALGRLTRSAKLSSLQKLNDKLRTRFFDKNDPSTASTIASVYSSMVLHSSDAVASVKEQVVPLVFLAMHDRPSGESGDSDEAGQQIWKDVWEELVPGTESAVAMFLPEIEALVCTTLRETQSWHLKAQAAAAIATLAEKAGPRLVPPHLWSVCDALVGALPGRVWEGKVFLLKAVKTVFTACKEEVERRGTDTPVSVTMVLEALFKECGKKNVLYKTTAMDSLGGILEVYNIDMFSNVFKIAQETINPERPSSDDEDEGGRGKRPDNSNIQLAVQACILLGKAWPSAASSTQEAYLLPVFSLVCQHAMGSVWKVQVAMMSTVATVFSKCKLEELPLAGEEFRAKVAVFSGISSSCLVNVKYSSLRVKTLEAVNSLTTVLKGHASVALAAFLTPELVDALKGLQNPKEKDLADSILKAMD